MIRRTISLPDDVATEIDALVAEGRAKNVSRFLTDAARRHSRALREEEVAAEAAALDPAEEIPLALRRPPSAGGPWRRLT